MTTADRNTYAISLALVNNAKSDHSRVYLVPSPRRQVRAFLGDQLEYHDKIVRVVDIELLGWGTTHQVFYSTLLILYDRYQTEITAFNEALTSFLDGDVHNGGGGKNPTLTIVVFGERKTDAKDFLVVVPGRARAVREYSSGISSIVRKKSVAVQLDSSAGARLLVCAVRAINYDGIAGYRDLFDGLMTLCRTRECRL